MAAKPTHPQLVVNLKAYPQTAGRKAVALAKAARRLEDQTGVIVAICPQAIDLRACVDSGARVYAQHFDKTEKPEATGWQSLQALVDAGCEGTLINHSEHRIPSPDIDWFTDVTRKAGLVSILCTKDAAESEHYAVSRPDLIAMEPPELIGGEISVTTADPQVIRRSVAAVRRTTANVKVLCGAGIKNAQDVSKAIELGAYGILVASGVTKATDPAKAMAQLAEGFVLKSSTSRR